MDMAYLTFNGKFLRYGGKMLTTTFEPPTPVIIYTVSFSPTSYKFLSTGGYAAVTQVTCTANGIGSTFTCAISQDNLNIIQTLHTTAGSSGSYIYVTAIDNESSHPNCAFATLAVTCGTTTEYFNLRQDGYTNLCF